MKILFLTTGLGMGGAEKVVISLADALAGKGHEVCIAYLTRAAVVLPVSASIRIINLGMASKLDVVGAFFRLRRLIRDFRPDVLHSHMFHANIVARLIKLVIPVRRLISTAHSSNEGGALRMMVYRLTDSLANLSTNVSDEAVEAFIKAKAVRRGRMIAVHNGIAIHSFEFNASARACIRQALLVGDRCQLILAVGRLHDSKDYPNLFHALALLPVNDFNYQLVIAGDGPLMGHLGALVVQLGIAERVRFLGMRNDVADLMSAADIFVLSSAWEGFPIVLMEAMANQRVLVATDCGGIREAIGDAGYLVKPKDSKALAQALQTALKLSAVEGAALGRAARQRVVEMYALDAVVVKWLQIYEGKVNSG